MSYIGTPPSNTFNTATSQTFTGNNSTTTFTLNRRVQAPEDLEVFVNNIQQQPTTSYTIGTNGLTLTFSEAPPSGPFYVVYRIEASTSAIDTGAARENSRGITHLLSATIGTVATYDIDSTYINSTYNQYKIQAEFLPETDDTYLYSRVYVGGVLQSGTIYGREVGALNASNYAHSNASSYFVRYNYWSIGNATGEGITINAELQNVNSTTRSCCISGLTNSFATNANHASTHFSGSLIVANAANIINGLQFKFLTGGGVDKNIANGSIKLYGIHG